MEEIAALARSAALSCRDKCADTSSLPGVAKLALILFTIVRTAADLLYGVLLIAAEVEACRPMGTSVCTTHYQKI